MYLEGEATVTLGKGLCQVHSLSPLQAAGFSHNALGGGGGRVC